MEPGARPLSTAMSRAAPGLFVGLALLSLTAFGCGDPHPAPLAVEGGAIRGEDGQPVFQDATLDSAVAAALEEADAALDLAGLRALTRLDAAGRGIADLSGIEALRALSWLDLSRNRLAELSPLGELSALKVLDLSQNRIADVAPLAPLVQLEELELAANAVREIAALQGLTRIRYLGVSGNPLSEASLAALQVLAARGVEVRNEVYVPESELATPALPEFRILYSGKSRNANYDLFALRSDRASDPLNLTRMPGAYTELAVSPDGARLAYLSDKEDRWTWYLYVLDLGTGLSRRLTEDPTGVKHLGSLAWSPDGTAIAAARRFWFPSTGRGYAEIYLIDAATGAMTDLTQRHENRVFHGSPAWSPDGHRLAFHRRRTSAGGVIDESQIHVLEVDGSESRLLVDGGSDPAWSPDGSQVLFTGSTGQMSGAICVVDVVSGAVEVLSRDPAGECCAAWSPDGRHIAFLSLRDGKGDIFVMDRRGAAQRNLTTQLGVMMPRVQPPAWSPDGQYLVGVSRSFPDSRHDVYALSVDGAQVANLTQHLLEGFTGDIIHVVPSGGP